MTDNNTIHRVYTILGRIVAYYDAAVSISVISTLIKQNQLYLSNLSFTKHKSILVFLRLLVTAKTFSLHKIKRIVNSYMLSNVNQTGRQLPLFVKVSDIPSVIQLNTSDAVDISSPIPMNRKPDGINVFEMFDPNVFKPGTYKLNPLSYSLKPEVMARYHCLSCSRCCHSGIVQQDCYFSVMLKCITHGWHIPCQYDQIQPLYHIHGNYEAVSRYKTSCDIEIGNMVKDQVLIPCDRKFVKFLTPMNAILKNSDKVRAKVLVNVIVSDQISLDLANTKLALMNQPKIKVRLAVDHTGTGLNAKTYAPSFMYPSLSHALSRVTRNCTMAIGDAERYFHSFPTAINDRYYFCVEYGGIVYSYARCSFGGSASPYYTSTWSAEFKRWLKYVYGIDSGHIVDDWFVANMLPEIARYEMSQCADMFETTGFSMNKDKFKIGKKVVFLGILIDSETMTLRFDAVQSNGFRIQLEYYLSILLSSKHINHSCIRPICGKLNWYAEILQSGCLHIRSWWLYEKHGDQLSRSTMLLLISDTQWWISLLKSWEQDYPLGYEHNILSADELLNEPFHIYIIQSDASGTDGYGYYHSWLDEVDPHFVSKRWTETLDSSIHSMLFELYALEDFLRNECYCRKCILIWITDNEAASYSINKGNCRNPASHITLTNILYLCDIYSIEIVALWLPREENQLADYLSHLSTYINRDINGNLSDLAFT